MKYEVQQTLEAEEDLYRFSTYIIEEFRNTKAAIDFLEHYYQKTKSLETFPFGYRGVSFEYKGYEIRLKPYGSYNIFFVVDVKEMKVVILRVLKDRQDWETILGRDQEYHFR